MKRNWPREQATARFWLAKIYAILAKGKRPHQGRLI